MDARVEKFINAFQLKGWTFIGSINTSPDWWFSDIFYLTSEWHPINTNIYLTLLVDPQSLGRKSVWSIGVSSNIPNSEHDEFIDQVNLNDIKRINLSAFVDNTNKIVLVEE